jgi:hypothetical protein
VTGLTVPSTFDACVTATMRGDIMMNGYYEPMTTLSALAAIGALLFGGAMLVSLWRNDADPIVDPRTGTEVLPLPRPHLLLVVLWPVVAVALLAVIIRHLGA